MYCEKIQAENERGRGQQNNRMQIKQSDQCADNTDDTTVSIRVANISKCYQIYEKPHDRLKQSIYTRLQKLSGFKPKQYFREFWALNNLSFEVKKGQSVGIIGRNGSGKSTLLQIICGTLRPSSGRIDINGRVAALLELGSGFNPEFTGRENVYMNSSLLGLSEEEINARFEDILAFADIGDFIDQPIKFYSNGMILRLAFSVIAHVDADILVIDEALAVGDAFFVQKCMRFLRKFMQTGTLLFVSHDTGAILNLCRKAIWLHEGSLKGEGEPKEIIELYLEKLYESQQGKSIRNISQKENNTNIDKNPLKDMRLDFINQSILRNDIELFSFSPNGPSFGKGAARVTNAHLMDEEGNTLSWVVGGEPVRLSINCFVKDNINSPIVGFQVKDRLGQVVFCDNTYLTYSHCPFSVKAGENLTAIFDFIMPLMPMGDYTISTAIAEGTQDEHIQHHWIHDALAFKVHASSVCLGLIGIAMTNIKLKKA